MDTDLKQVANVREAVERVLRRPISDQVWGWIEEDGYASEVEREEVPGIAEKVKQWERRIPPPAANPSQDPTGAQPDVKPHLSGTRIEARASLIASVYAMKAAESITVSRFRTEILDNRIDQEHACALIASPATRYLTPRTFREHDIPFMDHEAELIVDETVGEWNDRLGPLQRRLIAVFVDPPGLTFFHGPSFAYAGNLKEPSVLRLPPRVLRLLTDEQLEKTGLSIPAQNFVSRVDLPTHDDSVLDELRKIADWLSNGYGWQPSDAAWFVLTGEVPPIRLGTASGVSNPSFDHWGISFSLIVDLSATVDEVAEFYRHIQRQFVSSRQRPSPKGERLVRFVIDQGLPRPSWRELWRRWNETHIDRPYRGEAGHRNMKRDYERALNRFLFPKFDDYRGIQQGHMEIGPSHSSSQPAWITEDEHVRFGLPTPDVMKSGRLNRTKP